MNVIHEIDNTVIIKTLFLGDTFEYNNRHYVIINVFDPDGYFSKDMIMAFCLEDNSVYFFKEDTNVLPKTVQVIVKKS